MITLSFLKLLQDEGFGTLALLGNEPGADLFFQKLTLDKKGVYIADIGNPGAKGSRDTQSYELLVRGSNDVDGYKRLTEIRQFVIRNYSNICELPAVPPVSSVSYRNVELTRPSTITNVGMDDQNRIIYSMTGTIIYKEK